MSNSDVFRRALERIANYDRGAVDEWDHAAAFHAVQRMARDALDPEARAARIKAAESARRAERRQVGALQRGGCYFYEHVAGVDGSPPQGAWVRFLRGDGERGGIVHVRVLSLVGKTLDGWHIHGGRELTVHVSNLYAAPGVALP